MRLFRDPLTDDIRKFPFGSPELQGYYLYRDDEFTLLYIWYPVGDAYEPWNCHVQVLGAGQTAEVERNPQVLWRWRDGPNLSNLHMM